MFFFVFDISVGTADLRSLQKKRLSRRGSMAYALFVVRSKMLVCLVMIVLVHQDDLN